MEELLAGVLTLLASGLLSGFVSFRSRKAASVIGPAGTVLAAVLCLLPALRVMAGGPAESFRTPWNVPYGEIALGLDPLSAFFLLPILLLGALCAIYGAGYLRHPHAGRRIGFHWFHFNVLVATMVLVAVARNGMLFLVVWEAMALSSFFLVLHEDRDAAVRRAGWLYLAATHLGSAFLIALFGLAFSSTGTMDFDSWSRLGLQPEGTRSMLFLLALVGFGTKAGIVPFHVWLPDAHPAAPSHVSALMSGVMIKTGIYGLLRVLLFLGGPAPWWGWLLVAIGASSGILGVLFALAQHDLKRLLAYHSVENIGIIVLGIGVGVVGISIGSPAITALGFAGALLHVLNHAVFKGLLFLGAGSVHRATGTREMDRLGGLLRRMPVTGATFLVGALAISGVPPLNGFVSEFLILLGSLDGVTGESAAGALPLAAAIAALALIGGLAVACFTKAFGVVFLGEPRTRHARRAAESGPAMTGPMVALAGASIAIGLLPTLLLPAAAPAVATASGLPLADVTGELHAAVGPLVGITAGALLLLAIAGLLALLRRQLLAGRSVEAGVTWDCGYAAPTARMQYSSSSFAQPLVHTFRRVLRTRRVGAPVTGLFPVPTKLATETPDLFTEGLFRPAFAGTVRVLAGIRRIQKGPVQLYLLYIGAALVVLLAFGGR